jgi:murein DD-endopeptidase MepM/ murein hydrolase activator NlpD
VKQLLPGYVFAALLTAFLLLILMLGPCPLFAGEPDIIVGWQQFEQRVRDEQISYEEGLKEIQNWWGILQRGYPAAQYDDRFFFPLKGYELKNVGGRHGEGYRPSRFQFVGPHRKVGHPALDIFVYDGNQDNLDDRTGAPVEVLALAEGIVAAAFNDWEPMPQPASGQRGGNYLWIYHPALGFFSYYAHLQTLAVQPGDKVCGGEVIATLGRTGTNAYAERSPTHLHLMLLRASDMGPVNPYPWLKKASEVPLHAERSDNGVRRR